MITNIGTKKINIPDKLVEEYKKVCILSPYTFERLADSEDVDDTNSVEEIESAVIRAMREELEVNLQKSNIAKQIRDKGLT